MKVKFYHQASPFIRQVLRQKPEPGSKVVYINLNFDFFDISVIKSDRFSLYNTFAYQKNTDLIYFILYVYKQLELNPLNDKIILSGELCKDILYWNEIKKYIANVQYFNDFKNLKFSNKLNKLNKYLHLNILNLHNCE